MTATAFLAAVIAPAPHAAAVTAPSGKTQYVEAFAEDGTISRAKVPVVNSLSHPGTPQSAAASDGTVTPIVNNGSTGTKLDVVLIGDGYTESQQAQFHADAVKKWQEITSVEPYTTYRNLFNVWAVDAVSHDTGVSGDPDKDVVRDTALGSYFWCDDVERLLCVDTDKVEAYAAKAPQADLVIVVANSSKYGGAGYNDVVSPLGYEGIATVAGGNDRSGQIAVHETGHSLGKLADEYSYDTNGTYTGDEPQQSDITKSTADQLREDHTKWYRWLGRTSPDGGVVGTYEGAGYYPKGLYRPTENSIMRSLGREFNLPSREAMIAGFYRHASPLASSTPTEGVLGHADRVVVDLPVTGTQLRWYVDGHEVRRLRDHTSVRIRGLDLGGPRWRVHHLTAEATDPTPYVLDPELRQELTRSIDWRFTR
ncbi:M64 family metallopeptidase [Streptomyces sp. NK08204]|uniref:M64 family metallopeptidase n=1 Tax=Streptomyces sp. NK08204 TaxID=2873260 RepID=UPI001CECC222|nr:M64 family metallopeptidase [Streptomyces sp. NK08204]